VGRAVGKKHAQVRIALSTKALPLAACRGWCRFRAHRRRIQRGREAGHPVPIQNFVAAVEPVARAHKAGRSVSWLFPIRARESAHALLSSHNTAPGVNGCATLLGFLTFSIALLASRMFCDVEPYTGIDTAIAPFGAHLTQTHQQFRRWFPPSKVPSFSNRMHDARDPTRGGRPSARMVPV